MNNAVATRPENPVAKFSAFMDKFKPQMALALPKHLTADRMARLALTAFSSTPKLQECDPMTIAASIMTASTLGLEPGVNGQGYLIPYGRTCTFVPGWKGLVDIANRSGRSTVWTGAVFQGDHFEYALGDKPFVQHRPGDEDRADFLTHVYAVGRVNGSDWPVIEVWTVAKVKRHRDTYNKVGNKHYSFRDWEMYARKVPLLQVLKYMPSSIELSNAIAVSHAAESGRGVTIDGNFVTINDADPAGDDHGGDGEQDQGGDKREFYPADLFAKNVEAWKALILAKKKTPADVIAMAESKHPLTDEQKKVLTDTAPPVITYAHVADKIVKAQKAKDRDLLDVAGTLIGEVSDAEQRKQLKTQYDAADAALK